MGALGSAVLTESLADKLVEALAGRFASMIEDTMVGKVRAGVEAAGTAAAAAAGDDKADEAAPEEAEAA